MRNTMLVRTAACGALLALAGLLAACGEEAGAGDASADDSTSSDRITVAPADESGGHDHGTHDHSGAGHDHGANGDADGMSGDPDATPANQLPGAELRQGHFHLLDGAPEDSPDVDGHAYLARTDDGTTLSADLTGLEAGADYTSHLHVEACEPDSGGAHFKFDPAGSDQPPNEVHLALTAGDDGSVATTITNDNPRSQGATSMVLHLADGTKFACADLTN